MEEINMKYEILGFGLVALVLSIGLDFGKKWLGFIPEQAGVVFFWISLGSFGIYGLIVFLISVRKGWDEIKG